MNEKDIFKFTTAVFAILFLLTSITAVRFGVSDKCSRDISDRYRIELDTISTKNKELGEQLNTARTTNTELGRIIKESRGIVGDCREQLATSITTTRGAIELLRDIREKVVLLESRLSDSNDIFNSDDSSALSNEVNECQKQK